MYLACCSHQPVTRAQAAASISSLIGSGIPPKIYPEQFRQHTCKECPTAFVLYTLPDARLT